MRAEAGASASSSSGKKTKSPEASAEKLPKVNKWLQLKVRSGTVVPENGKRD